MRNRSEVGTSGPRRAVLDLIESGIGAVLPDVLLPRAVAWDPVRRSLIVNGRAHAVPGRLFVIGGGKASGLMAQAFEGVVGAGAITAGVVAEKSPPQEFATRKVRIVQAGHPVPDERGVEAVRAMLRLKGEFSIGAGDMVVCLISGGGSALMPCPADGITLEDKQAVVRLLLACGADIHEINTVRKHLSGTKGGRLAQRFAPAGVVSLIISDVVGNDLSVIASGPTSPDRSTYAEAIGVLEKFSLLEKAPASVRLVLEKGRAGQMPETPKALGNAANYIVGDSRVALEAMAARAREEGFRPLIVTWEQTGDTTEVARKRAQEVKSGAYAGHDVLLIGGETTPTLPQGHGKGGRNQHYAAVTAVALAGYAGKWVMASVGTDGSDYLPDIAGAIVDEGTAGVFRRKGLDFDRMLGCADSYTLLSGAGGSLIRTGDTHTNVGDIVVYLLGAGKRDTRMGLKIRNARAEELDELALVIRDAYMEYKPGIKEAWEFYLHDIMNVHARMKTSTLLAALLDGKPVGSVTMYTGKHAEEQGWPNGWAGLRILAVHPDYRGRGIGRALMDECVRRCRRRGIRTIGLHTTEAMAVARGMYERMGFIRVPEFDFHPTPEVTVMAYRLEV